MAATYDLANWVYPLLIGFHIMVNARDYPEYRDVLLSTFMLVMGLYGVVQYFVMPQWDVLWMIGSDMAAGRAGAVRRARVQHDELVGAVRVRDHGRAGVRVRRAAEDPLVRRGGRLRVVRAVSRALDVGRLGDRARDPARAVEQPRADADPDQRRRAGRPVRAAADRRAGGRPSRRAPAVDHEPEGRPQLRRPQQVLRHLRADGVHRRRRRRDGRDGASTKLSSDSGEPASTAASTAA